LLVWVAVVFLLMNNQWFVGGGGIQPPHFSRGYLFFPLALLMLLWLRGLPALRPFSAQNARSVLLTLLLIVAVPDNALFLYAVAARQPHPGVLTVQRETKEVLDFLNAQPGRLHILCPDTKLGVLIPAHTLHNSLIGDMMATPFWEEKRADLDRFLREGRRSGVLEKYGIDTIIIPAEWRYHFGQLVGDVRVRYQNALWIVYEVARS
jgi:hypothetical protein